MYDKCLCGSHPITHIDFFRKKQSDVGTRLPETAADGLATRRLLDGDRTGTKARSGRGTYLLSGLKARLLDPETLLLMDEQKEELLSVGESVVSCTHASEQAVEASNQIAQVEHEQVSRRGV